MAILELPDDVRQDILSRWACHDGHWIRRVSGGVETPNLPLRRMAEAHAQAAEAINRAVGQGAGYGYLPMALLGYAAAGNQGAYSTLNASTWTDVANTSFPVVISKTSFFKYEVYAAAHLSAAGAVGYVRGVIVGFDTTAGLQFGPTQVTNGTMPYFPITKGPIQPGTYTCKLQAATDNNTFNITVDQFFHMFLLLGA